MAVTLKPEYLSKWVPGGWIFRQTLPDNKGVWEAPNPLANTFRQQVGNILQWRKHNAGVAAKLKLKADFETIAQELIDQTVSRLQRMPKADVYLTSDSPAAAADEPGKKKHSVWSFVKGVAVAAVEGEEILREWLGAGGKPVSRDQAEHRALICADCPQNTRKHWGLFFTRPLAQAFAKTIEFKNQLKLETSRDSELGACKACSCVLPLKVHVPLSHVLAHTSQDTLGKLDPRCWILHQDVP